MCSPSAFFDLPTELVAVVCFHVTQLQDLSSLRSASQKVFQLVQKLWVLRFQKLHWQAHQLQKLVSYLTPLRACGTGAITMCIPPRDKVARMAKLLADEFGTASSIRSRVGRLSGLGVITSCQQRLKLYREIPPNGLVLFVGTILTDDGMKSHLSLCLASVSWIEIFLTSCA